MSDDELERLARDAAAWMKAESAATQAEVYLSRGEDRLLARREGVRDGVEANESSGAAVRVARGGRVGFASAGGAGLEGIKELYRRALEQLPHAEALEERALPGPRDDSGDGGLAATLWDDSLFTKTWDAVDAELAASEKAAVAAGASRVVRAEYSESRGTAIIAGTSGLFARERGSSASVSLTAAAEKGAEIQLGEGWRGARRSSGVDFAAAGDEAGRRARALLGGRRPKAGRRAVLFEPWVAGEFLELLADLLSAEEIQAGRSLLAGKLGKAVASPLVVLRDDPRLPGGLGSSRYDDEGLPTKDKAMIDKGVLRALLHDAETAARAGEQPNGCGYRGSYRGLPSPGASNLYLAPGALSREALIEDTKDGVIVSEILGLHMADPVTGAFSVGVAGSSIEKGRVAGAVKGAMLSGDILTLLGRVDGVASDLSFQGPLGSPTFRVSALDVA